MLSTYKEENYEEDEKTTQNKFVVSIILMDYTCDYTTQNNPPKQN